MRPSPAVFSGPPSCSLPFFPLFSRPKIDFVGFVCKGHPRFLSPLWAIVDLFRMFLAVLLYDPFLPSGRFQNFRPASNRFVRPGRGPEGVVVLTASKAPRAFFGLSLFIVPILLFSSPELFFFRSIFKSILPHALESLPTATLGEPSTQKHDYPFPPLPFYLQSYLMIKLFPLSFPRQIFPFIVKHDLLTPRPPRHSSPPSPIEVARGIYRDPSDGRPPDLSGSPLAFTRTIQDGQYDLMV